MKGRWLWPACAAAGTLVAAIGAPGRALGTGGGSGEQGPHVDPRYLFTAPHALRQGPRPRDDEAAALPFAAGAEGAGGARGARGAGSGLPTGEYAFFDGFETYEVDRAHRGQSGPGGGAARSGAHVVIRDVADPALFPGIAHASDPFGGMTPTGGDRDPAVDQCAQDARWNRSFGETVDGVRVDLPGFGFIPFEKIPSSGLLIAADFYFEDPDGAGPLTGRESMCSFEPYSRSNSRLVGRVLLNGVWSESPLADPDGFVRRPLVLGPGPSGAVGQFYAPPRDPAPGLPTFETKVGEWFTVCVRLSYEEVFWSYFESTEVWIRDSGTDGSAGILIDDPGYTIIGHGYEAEFLETGWARVYPGREPGVGVAMGDVTMFRGYGVARSETGAAASTSPHLIGAGYVDSVRTVVYPDPLEDAAPAGWRNVNHYVDNMVVIGPYGEGFSFEGPVRRLPYWDDMELYGAGAGVGGATDRWHDAGSGQTVIVDGLNTTPPPGSNPADPTPDQSILHSSVYTHSRMQREFWTALDFPMDERVASASPGSPLDVSAMLRSSGALTVWGAFVGDGGEPGQGEACLVGAAKPNDVVEWRFHIRLPNPLFDPERAESNDVRIDDEPARVGGAYDLGALVDLNPRCINFPTQVGVPNNVFFRLTLRLHGDGTGEWLANGAALRFDEAFLALSPELRGYLSAVNPGAGTGELSRFPADLAVVDQVEFWSGNNLPGFGDVIIVDDLRISGETRAVKRGPEFALPYSDDIECYEADQRIEGRGDTPLVIPPDDEALTAGLEPIALSDSLSGPFPGTTTWCAYTVSEVIADVDRCSLAPLPNEWGVAPGDLIYAQRPAGLNVCYQRLSEPGRANMRLRDPSGGRAEIGVRVGAPSMVTSNGAAADFRLRYGVFEPETTFCRYEVVSGGGMFFGYFGQPLMAGSVVAAGEVFAPDPESGLSRCPGVLNAQTEFSLRESDGTPLSAGDWILRSETAVSAQSGDVRDWSLQVERATRWRPMTRILDPSGGREGDGVVRLAAAERDEVKTALSDGVVVIDPDEVFGQVIAFVNNDLAQPSATEHYVDAAVRVPRARAMAADAPMMQAGSRAEIAWDLYLQDVNTRRLFTVTGDEGVVARVRFGGPDGLDGVPTGNIAIEVANPEAGAFPPVRERIFEDTGVEAPVGRWIRVRLEVDAEGAWRIGMNLAGIPGGPGGPAATGGSGEGDVTRFFDETVVGAHADARLIATGVSLETESSGGRISDISGMTISQGFDDEGDGVTEMSPVGAGVPPPAEISSLWWIDNIGVAVRGCPGCPWDLTGDGAVGAADLVFLLGTWGECAGLPSPKSCASADFDGNGRVGSLDLASLLSVWGACPGCP